MDVWVDRGDSGCVDRGECVNCVSQELQGLWRVKETATVGTVPPRRGVWMGVWVDSGCVDRGECVNCASRELQGLGGCVGRQSGVDIIG